MVLSPFPTQYAPAERSSDEEFELQLTRFQQDAALQLVADASPNILLILNQNRQVVYGNRRLVEVFAKEDFGFACGLRPGELFSCVHAVETAGGCGTSEFCRTCGAVKAILSGLNGKADVQECRITQQHSGEPLDLRVYTTPVQVAGEHYTFFAITDISNEKRRDVLERVFFHDVLNTAGGLHGLLSQLETVSDLSELKNIHKELFAVSQGLINEIAGQRELLCAENNEISLQMAPLHSRELIATVISAYQAHEVGQGKHLALDERAADFTFMSDKTLLARVIGNMLKNALEASSLGETVTAGCQKDEQTLRFWVHNPRYMPRNIQLQIFQRSFSTKGAGRGLGTYSMKLLGERYLKGKVSFLSDPEQGTTFQLELPWIVPAPPLGQAGLEAEEIKPLRILIADDNLFIRGVIQSILKKLGHHADAASNGLEVLQALKSAAYDVILMDGQMPEMDGFETTRQIRTGGPGSPQPRIIALTADGMPGDRERYLSLGMDDYLRKPVKPEELKKALSRS
jgi:CheY-like chemotaxis protein